MLWLVWIGREYEEMHGPHRLVAVYLIAGIGGGLLTVILANIAPGLFGADYVYGASASVIGLMTMVAVRYPYKSIALLFIGTVRLIYVVIAFLVLDLLFGWGGTAIAAHFGGALFGFLMAKGEANGMDLSSWANIFFQDRSSRKSARRSSRRAHTATSTEEDASLLSRLESWLASRGGEEKGGSKKERRRASIYPLRSSGSTDEAVATESEIDRILDKISEEGYDALTEEEKRILYEASKR
jgi:hypothetical protein